LFYLYQLMAEKKLLGRVNTDKIITIKMLPSSLPPDLTGQILAYLGCERRPPSIRYLNQLIQAYIRHVPWESVSRIVKRHHTVQASDCPRWPAEFWTETLSWGTGGTCFENNLAFYTLLSALGFTGYLTINDMQGQRACHTAILISWRGQKYLVDVAIPLHCALPVHSHRLTKHSTLFHHYTIRPARAGVFEIERSHHPKRNIYTLLDRPVPPHEYQAAVERDYEATGYFLDRVIIVKIIDDRLWRFNSLERPYKLEGFDKTSKQEVLLEPESMAHSLASKFSMAEAKIAAALECVA
jgi:arylamine N-acetyltransferase